MLKSQKTARLSPFTFADVRYYRCKRQRTSSVCRLLVPRPLILWFR